MSFNLGLEALAEPQAEMTGEVLSYEFLDTVMQFNDEAAEAVVIADGISALCGAYENLGAICDVLQAHGNSPALEALVGGNFREGFSMEAAKEAKDGLWARFVKWLKTLWAKIKAFFAKFFTSSKDMRTKLRARVQEIKNAGDIQEVSIKLPEISIMERNNEEIKRVLLDALKKANESLSDDQKLDVANAEKMFEGSDTRDPLERIVDAAAGEVTKVDMNKAIALLEKYEARLSILESVKGEIDKVADRLEKESFSLHKYQAIKKGETDNNGNPVSEEERKELNSGIKQYNKDLDESGKASDEYRTNVMKYHAQVSKWLSKATKNAISDASHLLSAFKPAKKK